MRVTQWSGADMWRIPIIAAERRITTTEITWFCAVASGARCVIKFARNVSSITVVALWLVWYHRGQRAAEKRRIPPRRRFLACISLLGPPKALLLRTPHLLEVLTQFNQLFRSQRTGTLPPEKAQRSMFPVREELAGTRIRASRAPPSPQRRASPRGMKRTPFSV